MVKRHKGNVFMTDIKNAMFEAYKTKNIPKLNDISQLLMELIYNNQQFRIKHRQLEPQGLYDDLDSFVSLYSQNLKFVSKLEFRS